MWERAKLLKKVSPSPLSPICRLRLRSDVLPAKLAALAQSVQPPSPTSKTSEMVGLFRIQPQLLPVAVILPKN